VASGSHDPSEPPRLTELLADEEEVATTFMEMPLAAPEPTQIIDSFAFSPDALEAHARGPERADSTVLLPAPDPGTIAGRYRLDQKIGAGGMGTVYRATHIALAKTVAIKLLNNQLATNPQHRDRIMREARAGANVTHENLISVTDVGETDEGIPFVVMEYVAGETLDLVLRREGRMPPRRVVRIGLQIAHALVAAHDRGLIHRDIKPANVVLVHGGKLDQIKVLDFGLVKVLGAISAEIAITDEQAIFGSPLFMSPEQCDNRPLDPRTDVYSLGATLYTLLIGHPPFEGSNAVSVMAAHLHVSVRSPRELDSSVPESLSAVIMRALAKDPTQRFGTMRELVAALVAIDAELARPTRPVMAVPQAPQMPVAQAMPSAAYPVVPQPQAMPSAAYPVVPQPQAMPSAAYPVVPRTMTGAQPPVQRGFEWTTTAVVIAFLIALIVIVVALIVIKLAIM
jgi:serine/threonine-protein kinase